MENQKKKGGCLHTILGFVCIVLVLLLALSFCGKEEGSDAETPEPPAQTEQQDTQQPSQTTEAQPEQTTVAEQPEPEAEPEQPQLTLAQQNAIGAATSYLEFTAFSRSGLIGQLEYEGYSTEDATFAVDNITVDWNEQAAKMAQQYLDYSSFSRSGLIDQLVYEGFTSEQAEYGVTAVGY